MEQADGLLAYILVNILDVAQFELSHGVAWHVFTMLESKKKKKKKNSWLHYMPRFLVNRCIASVPLM